MTPVLSIIILRERDLEKIKTAAEVLHGHISKNNVPAKQKQYDVFISYSHRNMDQGKTVLGLLHEKNPDLKIFFDYAELKTG